MGLCARGLYYASACKLLLNFSVKREGEGEGKKKIEQAA